MRTYGHWNVYNICFKIMNKTSFPFSQRACHPCNLNSDQYSFCSHGAGVNKVFFSWTSNITLTISKMNYVCSKYFSFEYILRKIDKKYGKKDWDFSYSAQTFIYVKGRSLIINEFAISHLKLWRVCII